jgi:hypothetical protein
MPRITTPALKLGMRFRYVTNGKIAALSYIFFFCNPILFAICTSTFSKLFKGSKPFMAFGNKTYKLNLKKLGLQIQQLH